MGITKTKIDWEKLKLEFITDPQKPTLENFCGTRKIPYSTARKRSGAEQWMADRNTHWNTVTTRAAPVIAEMQAVVLARDIGSKMSWIDEVRQLGLTFTRGMTAQNTDIGFGEVVQALERLEKLERLILGESTENIKVEDARAMVQAVVDAVVEEVKDDADRTRLLTRLQSLGNARANQRGGLN